MRDTFKCGLSGTNIIIYFAIKLIKFGINYLYIKYVYIIDILKAPNSMSY